MSSANLSVVIDCSLNPSSVYFNLTQSQNKVILLDAKIYSVRKGYPFFQEANEEQAVIVPEKTLFFVVGEQIVRPFIDITTGLAERFFRLPSYLEDLDRWLSFPMAEAVETNDLEQKLEAVFKEIVSHLIKNYQGSHGKMQQAFKDFKDAVDNGKGWENIKNNEYMKLMVPAEHQLGQAFASSKFYLDVLHQASQRIIEMQANRNNEALKSLELLLTTKITEIEAKIELLKAVEKKNLSEIESLQKALEAVVKSNKRLIAENKQWKQLSYFLEGQRAAEQNDAVGLAMAIEAMDDEL